MTTSEKLAREMAPFVGQKRLDAYVAALLRELAEELDKYGQAKLAVGVERDMAICAFNRASLYRHRADALAGSAQTPEPSSGRTDDSGG